ASLRSSARMPSRNRNIPLFIFALPDRHNSGDEVIAEASVIFVVDFDCDNRFTVFLKKFNCFQNFAHPALQAGI
ncbi:MAG: hypothetical protein ACI406_08905, partial [Victivallis vadensis]